MSDYLSYKHLLACPYSLSKLRFEDDKIVSVQTGNKYPIKNNQPDFRLKQVALQHNWAILDLK